MLQWPKFGNDTIARLPDPQHVLQHLARLARRLQGLRQDHVVEGVVGIIGKVGVGVALDHREPLGDAVVDALARNLDAAAVDVLGLGQEFQQLAVAAADVEHPRAGLDHLRRPPAGRRARCRRVRAACGGASSRCGRVCMFIMLPVKPARPRGAVEEAAHDREQFRLVEQEGVVALVGDDLGERDARAGGVQRMHDRARLRGRETASRW